MDFHTTISENGTIKIPEDMLSDLGIKPGSKVTLSFKKDDIIEVKSENKHSIEDFFGLGKKKEYKKN